jgi:hypothetical protein
VASIAVTQAALAGFGVLRRRPWAPIVWAAIYIAFFAGTVVLLGGAFLGALGKLMTAGAKPPPEQVLGLLGAIFGGYLLMIVVFWVLGAVINMAVIRSVLQPEAAAFAYMRLGAAELWLMAANFVLYVLYVLASTVVAIPVAIAATMAALAWKDGAPFVSLLVQLVTWGVTVWLGLRFCLAPPLIFTDRKFRLFESWALTRGHVGSLFLVGLVMGAVAVGVYVVLGAVGIAAAIPMAHQFAAFATPQAFFAQTPRQIWQALSPFVALYVVLAFIGSVILLPVLFAPWADTYRQLTQGDLAAPFS